MKHNPEVQLRSTDGFQNNKFNYSEKVFEFKQVEVVDYKNKVGGKDLSRIEDGESVKSLLVEMRNEIAGLNRRISELEKSDKKGDKESDKNSDGKLMHGEGSENHRQILDAYGM